MRESFDSFPYCLILFFTEKVKDAFVHVTKEVIKSSVEKTKWVKMVLFLLLDFASLAQMSSALRKYTHRQPNTHQPINLDDGVDRRLIELGLAGLTNW